MDKNTNTTHPFETAGLGLAPFAVVGMTKADKAGDPTLRYACGGSCDFCGTAIWNMYLIQSADGKQFKVGSDCVRKVGMVAELNAFKRNARAQEREDAGRVSKAAALAAEKLARAERAQAPFFQAMLGWVSFKAKPGFAQDFGRDMLERALVGLPMTEKQLALLAKLVRESHVVESDAHVGTVGKRTELTVTVLRRVVFETAYGMSAMWIMRDASGAALVWMTSSSSDLREGDVVKVKATIKEHSEYKGKKQTKLTRVAVVA